MTAKALFDAGFPTALSDSQATALGMKIYAHGGSYNGGNAPTITLFAGGGTLSQVAQADFIPYQMSDGTWRCKFNIVPILSSTSRTEITISIAGLTFFDNTSGGGDGQAVGGGSAYQTAAYFTYAVNNTGRIRAAHASIATAEYWFSGDVKLASKPTWAY